MMFSGGRFQPNKNTLAIAVGEEELLLIVKQNEVNLSKPREKIQWWKKYIKRSQEERNEMMREE